MCAARNLAAMHIRDATSWDPCGSGDETELVPKQSHFIEAELAPKTVSWTGLMRFGPKRFFSFYRVKLQVFIQYWGLRLCPKGESPGD